MESGLDVQFPDVVLAGDPPAPPQIHVCPHVVLTGRLRTGTVPWHVKPATTAAHVWPAPARIPLWSSTQVQLLQVTGHSWPIGVPPNTAAQPKAPTTVAQVWPNVGSTPFGSS